MTFQYSPRPRFPFLHHSFRYRRNILWRWRRVRQQMWESWGESFVEGFFIVSHKLIFYIHAPFCCLLYGICFILPPLPLMIRETLPTKRQAPVKVSPVVVLAVWRRFHKLKGVEIDRGYIGTDHCGVVLCYPCQQRLQPPVIAFTC